MKFKAPAGCTSVSVSGETFNADDDGTFTLPDEGSYAGLLAPHGFVQVNETAPAAAEPSKAAPTAADTKKARG
jgi:hypothetical protein